MTGRPKGAGSTIDDVAIRYTRMPERTTVFQQEWVTREGACTITLMRRTPLGTSVRAGDAVILEPDAPVLWFTFDGAWHDIGRFHTADGTFTGWYANILTPVEFTSDRDWATTDLFLDVWLPTDGAPSVLDEDELEDALAADVIDPGLAAAAQTEAARLVSLAGTGEWPPRIVHEWTLARALKWLGDRD